MLEEEKQKIRTSVSNTTIVRNVLGFKVLKGIEWLAIIIRGRKTKVKVNRGDDKELMSKASEVEEESRNGL